VVENSSTEIKSPQEELAEDLLSIVTVFTAKYHGARKYVKKDKGGGKN
jgi:predicted site-specific integrase-resolvase